MPGLGIWFLSARHQLHRALVMSDCIVSIDPFCSNQAEAIIAQVNHWPIAIQAAVSNMTYYAQHFARGTGMGRPAPT